MSEQTTIENVIKAAIAGEEDAYALYTNAAKTVQSAMARAMLQDLAKEEAGHKAKLQGLLRQGVSGSFTAGAFKRVADLKVGDHLTAKPLGEKADLQDVLIVAIQREKESHELYATMAGVACDTVVHNMLQFLANEELEHKRKLESLYEEVIYQHF